MKMPIFNVIKYNIVFFRLGHCAVKNLSHSGKTPPNGAEMFALTSSGPVKLCNLHTGKVCRINYHNHIEDKGIHRIGVILYDI